LVFGSSCVEDDKEFEEARKKEELIESEDRKMKASTPAEEKSPQRRSRLMKIRIRKVLIGVRDRS